MRAIPGRWGLLMRPHRPRPMRERMLNGQDQLLLARVLLSAPFAALMPVEMRKPFSEAPIVVHMPCSGAL